MAHALSQSLAGSLSGSENEEINTARTTFSMDGVIVAGEVPESDDEAEELFEDATDKSPSSPPSLSPKPSLPKSIHSQRKESIQRKNEEFQSLLHRKLREQNERFHKELIALNRNPYREAIKTMDETSSSASRSFKVVEDCSIRLKRLRDDLYLLKVSFDRLLINSSGIPRLKTLENEGAER